MTNTTNEKNIKSGSPLPGILIAVGIFLGIAGAGSMDYYYAAEDENRALGYEKNVVDYSKSDKEGTRTMILGALLAGAGAIALNRRESR